jgi:hypothetical protein
LAVALPVLPQQGFKRADVEIALIDRYKDLIEEASKCDIDALHQDKADIPRLVGVYAKLSAGAVTNSRKCGPSNFKLRSRRYDASIVVAASQSRLAFSGSRA